MVIAIVMFRKRSHLKFLSTVTGKTLKSSSNHKCLKLPFNPLSASGFYRWAALALNGSRLLYLENQWRAGFTGFTGFTVIKGHFLRKSFYEAYWVCYLQRYTHIVSQKSRFVHFLESDLWTTLDHYFLS